MVELGKAQPYLGLGFRKAIISAVQYSDKAMLKLIILSLDMSENVSSWLIWLRFSENFKV